MKDWRSPVRKSDPHPYTVKYLTVLGVWAMKHHPVCHFTFSIWRTKVLYEQTLWRRMRREDLCTGEYPASVDSRSGRRALEAISVHEGLKWVRTINVFSAATTRKVVGGGIMFIAMVGASVAYLVATSDEYFLSMPDCHRKKYFTCFSPWSCFLWCMMLLRSIIRRMIRIVVYDEKFSMPALAFAHLVIL